jgi:hypothetical protein
LRFGFFYFSHFPLSFFDSGFVPTNPEPVSQKSPAKTKSPRIQIFWHVGFGISFCTEVLDPQQPQARNVLFATATAAAATTHSLARHFHYLKRVRGIVRGVNTNPWVRKELMHLSSCLDAAAWEGVMRAN